MATFEKYTSGFDVNGVGLGIQAAKITKDVVDERVVTAIDATAAANSASIPNAAAVSAFVGEAAGVDAIKALDDAAFESTVSSDPSYGVAKKATSAAGADKLNTAVKVELTGDVAGSVASWDGSSDLTIETTFTDVATEIVPASASTKTGIAAASAVERALAAADSDVETVSAAVSAIEALDTAAFVSTDPDAETGYGVAKAAMSAAAADKLKTAQSITFEGGATGSVSFDGSEAVTATMTVPYSAVSGFGETSVVPSADSTKGGLVQASAIEKALAALESEIGQIGAFDGPYATTADIPKDDDDKYDTHKIFLVGPVTGAEGADKYEEYISSTGETLTMIGDTTLDLTPYVRIENISAASANWDAASAYVESASANIATASGYATAWHEFSTAEEGEISDLAALQGSATSGAAASAWIAENGALLESPVTASGDMTEENKAKLAQVGAITGYVEDKIAETIAETIDIASEITTSTETSAIPNVGAVTGYVGTQLGNVWYYSKVKVNDTEVTDAAADSPSASVNFVNGDGVTVVGDGANIKFNSNIEITKKLGDGTASAITPTTAGGKVTYAIEIPESTSAVAGINKSAYVDNDNIIHIF